jgi:hypothetical protein
MSKYAVIEPGQHVNDSQKFDSLYPAKQSANSKGGAIVAEERLPGHWVTVYDPYVEAEKQYEREHPAGPPTIADLKWIRPDLYW